MRFMKRKKKGGGVEKRIFNVVEYFNLEIYETYNFKQCYIHVNIRFK